jgi:predicted aspartyl protease
VARQRLLIAAITLLAGGCRSLPTPSVAVPFESPKNQIVLEARINGRGPYSMLLDTLVSPSVIDLRTATEIGLPVDISRSGEAEGVGSETARIHASTIQSLEIGGVKFGDVEALAFDMTGLSERIGRPLHGVLGHSFLRNKVVTIDYPARRVFINPGKRSRAAERLEVPFVIGADDLLIVPAQFQVNGVEVPVSIDTGSSLTLSLYGPAVERLRLETPGQDASTSITGARGDAVLRKTTVKSIGIGPFTMTDAEITISDRRDYGEGREGNAGNGFLQNFVVTFDYPRRVMILEKPE